MIVNSKVCKQSENAYKRDIYYKHTLNEKLVYNMNSCLKCTISDNADKNMARYILLLLLLVLFYVASTTTVIGRLRIFMIYRTSEGAKLHSMHVI